MPECHQILSLLSDYLDRDLPPESCEMMAQHLESCRTCETAAEELRSAVSLCRQYRMESKPSPLRQEQHDDLRRVFQKTLSEMKTRS